MCIHIHYMYTHMCVYMYICTSTYIYIYTHIISDIEEYSLLAYYSIMPYVVTYHTMLYCTLLYYEYIVRHANHRKSSRSLSGWSSGTSAC